MAFKDTRVQLKPRTEENLLAASYINACFVDSPLKHGDNRLIASQGPLPHTVSDFWRMISQEGVTMVVTTCRLKEGNAKKCE